MCLQYQAEGKWMPEANRAFMRAQEPYLPRLSGLFHTVEHGAQLRQPLSVNSSHALHVLLQADPRVVITEGRGFRLPSQGGSTIRSSVGRALTPSPLRLT